MRIFGQLPKRVYRKVREVPAIVGSFVLAAPPLSTRSEQSYISARRAHQARLPPLERHETEIIAEVEARGICCTSLDALDFPGSKAMLDAGQRLASRYVALEREGALRDRDAFQADAKDVLQFPEILNWGLQPKVLQMAESYLQLPVAFDGINIFFTKADGREVAARKWHLDKEDRRILKIAVYLNDVDPNGGPFEALHVDVPRRRFIEKARAPIYTHKRLEKTLARPLSDGDIISCTGPAGTVIFCDTARMYHRAKPARLKSRCAVFYNYFSRSPLRPFYCERGTLSRAQLRTLASGLSASERDALLWRDSLPLFSRLVPPAPIA